MPEAWLTGPVAGVPPFLQPVAHALLNAKEQVEAAIEVLDAEQLAARPGGAASIAWHVTHAIGSLDRLFTYARGDSLSDVQRATLEAEQRPTNSPPNAAELIADFARSVEKAIDQLRGTDEKTLLEVREVGRARLPSSVLGLLFHGGEHTARHAGQVVTTAKLARKAG
ncbi:MAG: DinB family protein [Gemmatimonadaceae bacterium]